jgi:hypothetical protein
MWRKYLVWWRQCSMGHEWSRPLKLLQLLTHTLMASRSWSNMLGKDHSRTMLIYGTLRHSCLIYSQSLTCTKSKGWSCTVCQRCGTRQAMKLWLHFYDGQFRLTAHNCRTSACLSWSESFLIEYSHMIGRSYALIILNLCTISIEDYLKGCTRVPCSFNVLFKCFYLCNKQLKRYVNLLQWVHL